MFPCRPEIGEGFCQAARATHATLQPANGKMAAVRIVGLGRPSNLTILGMTQDEPVGHEPDAIIDSGGSVSPRRERDDDGEGRVFLISYSANFSRFSCQGTVAVSVPVDNVTTALNHGALYDSAATGSETKRVPGASRLGIRPEPALLRRVNWKGVSAVRKPGAYPEYGSLAPLAPGRLPWPPISR